MSTTYVPEKPSLIVAERPINGVAFDLEGNSINVESFHFAAHVETANSLGIKIDLNDQEAFNQLVLSDVPHFIGGPDRAIMEEFVTLAEQRGTLKRTNGEERKNQLKQLLKYDHAIYRDLLDAQDRIEPREGFLEFLEQLRSMDIPMAIGSLTDDDDARILLEKSGLNECFHPNSIILRSHVKEVKPNPEVYMKTAKCMGVDSRSQLVFGDSHNDMRAARDAGSLPIGMPTVWQPAVLDRMRDAGAIAIFRDWKDVTIDNLRSIER